MPWRGNDLSKVKTHFTTQTSQLFEVLVTGVAADACMRYHTHALCFRGGCIERKHSPFLWLQEYCPNCQSMEQNADRSLSFIQVIKPVNCCMSIHKSVSPTSVFLLSARGSVAQVTPLRHRIYLLRYSPSPWTHSGPNLVQFDCDH